MSPRRVRLGYQASPPHLHACLRAFNEAEARAPRIRLAGQALTGAGVQTGAAQNLGNLGLGIGGLEGQAGENLASNYLSGNSQAINAASNLGSQALTGLGLQQGAASTLGSQALQALSQEAGSANNLQNAYGQNMQQTLGSLALAPTTQQMPYTDLSMEYNAGATGQANQQAAINDAVQRYNYNETLPYNMLNQYIGETTGNYGGSTSLTQPYFSNTGANVLGDALGGASLGSALFGAGSMGTAGGAGLGALMALL